MNDFDRTHLNSSKGNVVFGGSPGLKVTMRKKIEKFMTIEPSFFSKPILNNFNFKTNFTCNYRVNDEFSILTLIRTILGVDCDVLLTLSKCSSRYLRTKLFYRVKFRCRLNMTHVTERHLRDVP